MELTKKKPKSHTVEKSRDQVLANKKALKSDQRSKPEANTPMTEDPRSSPVTKKSRDKVMANKTAILGDQKLIRWKLKKISPIQKSQGHIQEPTGQGRK